MRGSGSFTRATLVTTALNALATAYTQAAGSGIRLTRFKLYDLILGSDSTPADVAINFQLATTTTAPTGGAAVTMNPLDQADAAMSTLGMQACTGGNAVGVVQATIPLNQRASFRWVAAPGSEIVAPATAGHGVTILTPTLNGGSPDGFASLFIDEQ